MKIIKTVDELKKKILKGNCDYFIVLAGGLVRSSKHITYDPKTKRFSVLNLIDDTRQSFTEKTILDKTKTNIGEAMIKNSFIME